MLNEEHPHVLSVHEILRAMNFASIRCASNSLFLFLSLKKEEENNQHQLHLAKALRLFKRVLFRSVDVFDKTIQDLTPVFVPFASHPSTMPLMCVKRHQTVCVDLQDALWRF